MSRTSLDTRIAMAVKSAVMFIVVFVTAGTAAAQNAQRNITLENTGPLADDLKAMKLKDSDAELKIEVNDQALPDLMPYTVTLPVHQTKEVSVWTISGKGHLSLKVSFRGTVCANLTMLGSLRSRYKFRLKSISPVTCASEL